MAVTPAKREYYSPSKVKVRVIGYGILTVFLFFFATLYIDALGNLFRVNMECSETLSKLFSQVDQNEAIKNASRDLYDSYHTADMELILLYAYLDKVRNGEMELDFKIIDLIKELDLL